MLPTGVGLGVSVLSKGEKKMQASTVWRATDSEGEHTLHTFVDADNTIVHGAYRVNGRFIRCFNNGYDAYDYFVILDPTEMFDGVTFVRSEATDE